jgi:hypothetical protein
MNSDLEHDLSKYRQGDNITLSREQISVIASRHHIDPIAVIISVNTLQAHIRLESANRGARRLLGLKETEK